MCVNSEFCFEFQRCRIDLCKVFYSMFSIKYVILLQCLLYLFLINISRISLECKEMVSGYKIVNFLLVCITVYILIKQTIVLYIYIYILINLYL